VESVWLEEDERRADWWNYSFKKMKGGLIGGIIVLRR